MSVPTTSPLIIATAILAYIGSVRSGTIPIIVVNDVSSTGRVRDMVAFTSALNFSTPLAISISASSISTIAFFTIIPINPNEPIIAMKVNGCPVRIIPYTIPTKAIGIHKITIIGFLKSLKSSISVSIMSKIEIGINLKILVSASLCNSYSPTHTAL